MAAISTLTDTFPGPTLNAQWATAVNGTISAVTIDTGRAKLVAGTEANSFALLYSATTYTLTGDSVYFQIESFGGQPTDWSVQLLIDVDGSSSNYARIMINAAEVLGQVFNGGVMVYEGSAVAYSATAHKWLRIRHTSGDDTLHFEASPDGTAWTDLYQSSDHTWSVASVLTGVRALCTSVSTSPGLVAYIDNVNTPPASGPPSSWSRFFFRNSGRVSTGGGGGGTPLFVGDYSTSNFAQWPTIQNTLRNDTGSGWPSTGQYQAQIVTDGVKGPTARFELRQGDDFGIGERTEVQTTQSLTGITDGATRWYKFAVKFDASFYTPGAGGDVWGVTNQWHSTGVTFGHLGWDNPNQWTIDIKNDAAATNFTIWGTDFDRGNWHDILMEVKWSPTAGTIRLWHNGSAQTLLGGGTTWTGNTLNQVYPTGPWYYKEGMYRSTRSETAIVYHQGFKSGLTQADVT